LKKKWTNVNKDPSKGIKDQNTTQTYWHLLNHLPQKGVDNIVNDKIINYDKSSCEHILKKYYESIQNEEFKKENIQTERQDLLLKLKQQHDRVMSLEEKSGIKHTKAGKLAYRQTKNRSVVNQKQPSGHNGGSAANGN
jgi:hypothetical protein